LTDPPKPIESGHDWEASYAGVPPWDIGRPQPVFLRLASSGQLHGRVLDVGCGTGEHALMAAALGLSVTGVDVAPTAIRAAQRKAEDRKLDVRFVEWDAFDLPGLGEHFDTVLDCGVFHVFDDDERRRFVDALRSVTVAGGRYHMLCFSELEAGDWGPRRVTEREFREAFADGWHVESLERAVLDLTTRPDGAQAWSATVRRS
jgi:cyclopropane fatty-acyl-phospholipid synthase-like methyltransferase